MGWLLATFIAIVIITWTLRQLDKDHTTRESLWTDWGSGGTNIHPRVYPPERPYSETDPGVAFLAEPRPSQSEDIAYLRRRVARQDMEISNLLVRVQHIESLLPEELKR